MKKWDLFRLFFSNSLPLFIKKSDLSETRIDYADKKKRNFKISYINYVSMVYQNKRDVGGCCRGLR